MIRLAAGVFARRLTRVAAVIALGAAFLALIALQEVELRRERAGYTYLMTTNNWALSQLGFELERFLGALDRYMLGVPDTDFEALSTRFDILWSRIPVLLAGPETAEVRAIEGAVERLEAFAATLAAAEADLMALMTLDRERYGRIRRALSMFRLPIHDLTVELYSGRHFKSQVARIRESHRRAAIYQWSMLAVVGALAAFLGIEMIHSARRARDETEARRAAEAANLAKSTFLAAMSHELRTPLNAIMGFSEIQERELFGPLPVRYRNYARDIHASADHLLAVLNDILDMARVDARRMTLHEEEFDPSDAVYASIRMVEAERERAGLRLAVDIRTAGVMLCADRRLFRQIVLNLLSNAIKFTPTGGTVRIALDGDDGGLVLTVEDTGAGIPVEVLDRVTEPFFQGDQTHARRHQGVGLGLSLVRGFAELHGGSVSIDSGPDRGTRVSVAFPAARVLHADINRAGAARSHMASEQARA